MLKFDWSLLFGFLGGIFTGVTLTFLIYLFFVLKTTKKNPKIVEARVTITDEEMVERIKKTQQAFKDKKLKGNKSINYALDLCQKLIVDTASDFFPNSRHPLLELSIDEFMLLATYINKRIDEVLDYRGLRILRRVKVSTIMNISDAKKSFDDNPIVKASRKYKIAATWNATRKVINLINPFWWAKKLVVSTSMNIIINKMCLIVIGVVGEETYKIYSKKVFEEERYIDSGNEAIARTFTEDINENDANGEENS